MALVSELDALSARLAKTARGIEGGTMLQIVGTPVELMYRMMRDLAHMTAIRLFLKWNVFDHIPAEDGSAISYAAISDRVGAEEGLIARLGRALVSYGTLRQGPGDGVMHTDFSLSLLAEPLARALIEATLDTHLTALATLPQYFASVGLVEPPNPLQSPLAFAENRLGTSVFEIVHGDLARRAAFMAAMGAFEAELPALAGGYDLSWAVEQAAREKGRVLVVDVGGGKGQALVSIFRDVPALPKERCVLQDLPEVVEAAKKEGKKELEGVRMQEVDMHTGQPEKG
ncbi:hypothetical protein C8A05DRAFT_20041, partial [Staphylotrichum tortipilum]